MLKPNLQDFNTDTGYHTAMQKYADSFDKKPLLVSVVYSDGSVEHNFHIFQRAKIQKGSYKTHDGTMWEIMVDSAKYDPDFLPDHNGPLTRKELEKAVKAWLHKNCAVESIKFKNISE